MAKDKKMTLEDLLRMKVRYVNPFTLREVEITPSFLITVQSDNAMFEGKPAVRIIVHAMDHDSTTLDFCVVGNELHDIGALNLYEQSLSRIKRKNDETCVSDGEQFETISHIDDISESVSQQLAVVMAAKTDDILHDAVCRFLGRDDWKLHELQGRGVMHHFISGCDIFCLDGVAIVEFLPVTVEFGDGNVIHATRQYKFLI